MNKKFQWVTFYEAFADKMFEYKDRRNDLYKIIKDLSSEDPYMEFLHFERDDWWEPRNYAIDPFSVMAIFNRGLTDANRISLAKKLADTFAVNIPIPSEFHGIPVLNNQRSTFGGTDKIWDLCISVMESSDGKDFSSEFETAFEEAIAMPGNGLASITTGLFWIRPNIFMPLDSRSRSYIPSKGRQHFIGQIAKQQINYALLAMF